MQRLSGPSQSWVFYLTAGLLFASALLRSLLLYGGDPIIVQALGLLAAWLILFASETATSLGWPGRFTWYFPIYLVLQTLVTLGLLFLPNSPDYFGILFGILSMQVIQHWNPRVGAIWIALFSLLLILPLVRIFGPANGLAFALIYTAINVLLAFYALTTRRAEAVRTQNEALAQQLQTANRQLQTYSTRLEQLAAARERQRLARELHDSVTQTIFSMTLTTQSATLLLERDPDRVGAQLARLTQLAQNALSELRVLIAELGSEKSGAETLNVRLRRHLAERPLPDNLSITFEADGTRTLSQAEEQSLFRIAQEALNNIVKHAHAARAYIRLHLAEPFWMEIQDDGQGFDLEYARNDGRVGLTSMRERAAEIGWDLHISTGRGRGTCIRVEKPAGERQA